MELQARTGACVRVGMGLLLVLGALPLGGCGPAPDYYVGEARVPDPPSDRARILSRAPELASRNEPASAPATDLLRGRWVGAVMRSDGLQRTIEVDVSWTEPGLCAVVRYPDMGCSGYWTCTPGTSGNRLRAIEHITSSTSSNGERCSAGADIEIKVASPDDVSFRSSGERIMSVANLARGEIGEEPATQPNELDAECSEPIFVDPARTTSRSCGPGRSIDTTYPDEPASVENRRARPIDREYRR